MSQSFAVWLVIGIALITANLPFVLQRPFCILPWMQEGEPPMPAWRRAALSLLFFILLVAAGWMGWMLISGGIVAGGGAGIFMLRLLGAVVPVILLLAYPGWLNRGREIQKSFISRLIEVLVFYGLAGTLGFALETSLGNRFAQNWEFYAITLSLFLVLGYPGFVFRYLLRRPKRARGTHVSS